VSCRLIACVAAAFVGIGFADAPGAAAQTRTIRLVVPFAPGGATDITARTVGQRLSQALSQPVVVDNRPGGGGNIGADLVAKAAPDGHIILVGSSYLSANPSLYSNLAYDVTSDLTPLGAGVDAPLVLIANPKFPPSTVAEIIAFAKAHPGDVNIASAGVGTLGHLGAELLNQMAGTKITHVPYRGSAPAVSDLIGGQVQLMIDTVGSALAHIQTGAVKAVAVPGRTRYKLLPGVPTMAESGVPDFEVSVWNAFFLPARTPAAMVERLNGETAKILEAADVRQQLETRGLEVFADTPERFAARLHADIAKWSKVIKAAQIKVE
jgi:tripartite-type tricarboxylate transporter receptor subunit TctC